MPSPVVLHLSRPYANADEYLKREAWSIDTRSMLLVGQADGSVVFTLDARGQHPRAYWGAYAASKAGTATLAAILADEWENRPNLRVNAVVPGPIRSPLRMQTHPGEERSSLADPASLVPLYLYLLGAQPKSESGVIVDAQAWLRDQPSTASLLPGDSNGARL